MQFGQPVDELGPGVLGEDLVGGDIVAKGGVGSFLVDEEADVLVEVLCDHLGVGGFGFVFLEFGDDDGFVSGGDGGFEVFEFVVVDHGVVPLVAVGIVFEEVGELPTEDSVFHVSVRLIL